MLGRKWSDENLHYPYTLMLNTFRHYRHNIFFILSFRFHLLMRCLYAVLCNFLIIIVIILLIRGRFFYVPIFVKSISGAFHLSIHEWGKSKSAIQWKHGILHEFVLHMEYKIYVQHQILSRKNMIILMYPLSIELHCP